jgi:hypothetical protein
VRKPATSFVFRAEWGEIKERQNSRGTHTHSQTKLYTQLISNKTTARCGCSRFFKERERRRRADAFSLRLLAFIIFFLCAFHHLFVPRSFEKSQQLFSLLSEMLKRFV